MPEKEKNKSDYPSLISRYLSGNASNAEVEELEAWVSASPEHKEQFMAFKKAWLLSGMKRHSNKTSSSSSWEQTSNKLFKETPVIPIRKKIQTWVALAAALALLIMASFWVLDIGKGNSAVQFTSTNVPKSINLPDGSKVRMNQASSIQYLEDSKLSTRTVDLKGSAFFEVQKSATKPFVIQTQALKISVLGTSFFVDSRDTERAIQVIVATGLVAVNSSTDSVLLQKGDKAIFLKDKNQLVKVNNQDSNFLSFVSDTLKFETADLEEVVFALNRHFNANIKLQVKDLSNCKVTATFRDKSLETILTVLEASLSGIQVEYREQQIIISGMGCK